MKKKIAFIYGGSFSHINESIRKLLINIYSEYELLNIDIWRDLRKENKRIILINHIQTIFDYGFDILYKNRKYRKCFIRTGYIFHKIKAFIAEKMLNENVVFTFQTQSLFDASCQNLPHFIFTDHTHLANLDYGVLGREQIFPQKWLRMEQSIYDNANIIFTMSTNIAKSLQSNYKINPQKTVCAYIGANALIDSSNLSEQRYANKCILFVGVDWERKGGPELAQAFERVLKVYPDAKLIIVGCSPEINLPNCRVAGRVSLEAVPSYYKQASLFCMPTRIEAFGNVFIEAMSCKLPIIATQIGAIPDFVQNDVNGYLIQKNNVDQLTAALLKLLPDEKKCKKFGERGFKLIQNRYNWNSVGNLLKQHIAPLIR